MTTGSTTDSGSRRVMGTIANVVLHGEAAGGEHVSAAAVLDGLDELEAAWSRFRPDSELSRLNASSGAVTVLSDPTYRLVEHLVRAHQLTGGRFDPTLHDQLVALGYDRTYRSLPDRGAAAHASFGSSAVSSGGSCADILLMKAASAVLLPAGLRLDPGGLGKGLAADLVANRALEHGAAGVLVEIGGDIVTRGLGPDGDPWRIRIPPTDTHPERIIEITDGAVATSDTAARTWSRDGSTVHHILDPGSGRPLDGHLIVTAIAGAGWWAEAIATAAMVSAARDDGWFDDARADELGVTTFVTASPIAKLPADA